MQNEIKKSNSAQSQNKASKNKQRPSQGRGTGANKLLHSDFIQFCKTHTTSALSFKKARRSTAKTTDKTGFTNITKEEFNVMSKALVLYPEALAYLFHLEGCSKRLFLFLLMFHTEKATGIVLFNNSVILEFISFCKLFSTDYKEESVKQALKDLRDRNIIVNVQRGKNMMNPMVTGGGSEKARIHLISEYSFKVLESGKDATEGFYPRYGN